MSWIASPASQETFAFVPTTGMPAIVGSFPDANDRLLALVVSSVKRPSRSTHELPASAGPPPLSSILASPSTMPRSVRRIAPSRGSRSSPASRTGVSDVHASPARRKQVDQAVRVPTVTSVSQPGAAGFGRTIAPGSSGRWSSAAHARTCPLDCAQRAGSTRTVPSSRCGDTNLPCTSIRPGTLKEKLPSAATGTVGPGPLKPLVEAWHGGKQIP